MMTENFEHKIRRLELENFTCFTKAEMDFSSGVNVFIGENGTGKTHVLKVLYVFLRKGWIGGEVKEAAEFRIATNLAEIFKPKKSDLSRLFSKGKIEGRLSIHFDKGKNGKFQFYNFTKDNTKDNKGFRLQSSKNFDEKIIDKSLLFIPNHEMLTFFDGFMAAYKRRENSFDGTYYDIAESLSLKPLINEDLKNTKVLINEFEKEVNIEVFEENGQFYLKFQNGVEVEAQLAAEGLKKLAQMIYLIQNGSLNKNTILFWDEPETNLNPKYIKIVAQFLQTLAKNGVQIFVATHDYLLTYWLSLAAEYPNEDTPPMRFFSLSKGEDGTEVEAANTMNGLKNNVLLDEYSAYSDAVLAKSFDSLNEPV